MLVKYFIQFSLFILSCEYTASKETPALLQSWCDGLVPSSVEVDSSIWKLDLPVDVPKVDDLDKYMMHQTGCTHRAIEYAHGFHPLAETTAHELKYGDLDFRSHVVFNGSLFKWRGAVRAKDEAAVQISWSDGTNHTTYNFYIGQDDNTVTKMYHYGYNSWQLPTPGILSTERYVPFYVKIQSGILTFGKDCDSEPMFSRNVTVGRGETLEVYCFTWSRIGAKLLYDCPDIADRAGNLHQHEAATILLIFSTFLLSFIM